MVGGTARSELSSVLMDRAMKTPGMSAVTFVSDPGDVSGSLERTYAELDIHARRIASWLRERFPPGDRALLLYSPGIEFATAFFACLYAGLVAVPCPKPGRYQHERRRLAGIAGDAGVSMVLTGEADLPVIGKWLEEEGISGITCHATDTGAGDPEAWSMPETTSETLALLQYTSGSTGEPKGVMVTHGNLLTNVDSVIGALGLDSSHRFGGWIPLYHDMGLIGLMLPGVLRGTGYVQMDPMTFLRRPQHWLRMMDVFDVNATASPDFGYELCHRRVTDDQLATLDLSRILAAVNGSEPVRAGTLTRFCDRFGAAGFRPESLVPMYGLAEATLLATGYSGRPPRVTAVDVPALEQQVVRHAGPGTPSRDLVGCGGPNGLDVVIVDPGTGEVLPAGGVGEIWLRGPSVTTGYWGKDEATESVFHARTADGQGPFLRTGDLGGTLDGDLFVTGRRKDTLVLHGRNLHPQDIEHELRASHEELGGLHGAVFTVGGTDGITEDETVVLVHEIRGHWGEERMREVAAAMKLGVAKEFGVPVGGVVLVRPGAVRRTTSGKVQRSTMRELYVAGELVPLLKSEDPLLASALAGSGR
jgi:acyl-CoA synthetase (AMP-forming)/AMP-acid ligase II